MIINSILLAAALLAPTPKPYALRFPVQEGRDLQLQTVAKPLKAALVSPLTTPEWVKGYEVLGDDGTPSSYERLAKVRVKVLDSYPATNLREMTCYVPVLVNCALLAAPSSKVPDAIAPLAAGRYVLTYTEERAGTKLKVPRVFRWLHEFPDVPVPETDAVCGGSLAGTDASGLSGGRDLRAVLLRSFVEALKSRSSASVRSAIMGIERIQPPLDNQGKPKDAPEYQGVTVNGTPAYRFYTEELVPKIFAIANQSTPARKLSLYGLLGLWGQKVDPNLALDALLALAECKDWDGFTVWNQFDGSLMEFGQFDQVGWQKWLATVEALPKGSLQDLVMTHFSPDSAPQKEWSRLLQAISGAGELGVAGGLAKLEGWAHYPKELEGLSVDERIRYWRSRLGVNP